MNRENTENNINGLVTAFNEREMLDRYTKVLTRIFTRMGSLYTDICYRCMVDDDADNTIIHVEFLCVGQKSLLVNVYKGESGFMFDIRGTTDHRGNSFQYILQDHREIFEIIAVDLGVMCRFLRANPVYANNNFPPTHKL